MRLDIAALVLHVSANVVWVGALLAAVVLAGVASEEVGVRGRLALKVYRNLAVPGFLGSLVFGLLRLGLDWKYYLVATHFMHVKLLLVAIAIALHHVVGARLRRMTREDKVPVGLGWMGLTFGLLTLGSIIMAVAKPF